MEEAEINKSSKAKALLDLIIVFTIIILLSGTLGLLSTTFISWVYQLSLNEVVNDPTLWSPESINFIKINLVFNHLFTFILPPLIFVALYKRETIANYFNLKKDLSIYYLSLSIIILIVSVPLVHYSFYLNQQIDLPDFLQSMESRTEELMKAILSEKTIPALLTNLFLIAVIPALGEELLFRGILQKKLITIFNNKWVGVTLAAIIFSAIHFQFEGFLPRAILGFILGAIYLYTNNLWYPIIAHFFNNGIQVVLAYFNPEMVEDVNTPITMPWYLALLSLILIIIIMIQFKKFNFQSNKEAYGTGL